MRWSKIVFVSACIGSGCGGSGDPVSGGTTDPPADGGDAGLYTPDAASEAVPVVCGGQAEMCCSSGALCAPGLTCSDEFCLACGAIPPPAPGCMNLATQGISSATAFGGGASDAALNVNDGDVCTSWNYGSYSDGNARWEVDLGTVQQLDTLVLWPKMTPADGTVQFLIEYKPTESSPYVAWPTAGGLALVLHDYRPWQATFSPPISARFVRVTIQRSPSFAALREVGLYTGCDADAAP